MCRYCKDNPDRKYSRCKVPQEMSDKEINEELGMDDDEGPVVTEEAPRVLPGLQSPLEPFPSHVAKTLDVNNDAVLSGWLTIPNPFSISCIAIHILRCILFSCCWFQVFAKFGHLHVSYVRGGVAADSAVYRNGGFSGGRAGKAVER